MQCQSGSLIIIIPTLFVLNFLPGAISFSLYRDRIPNGHNVKCPFNKGAAWGGVGHLSERGGGERNPFGLDFAANNHQWSRALCELDSDGDGKTNGEELGDPLCIWTEDAQFTNSSTISHPGVCEPVDSEECQLKNYARSIKPCKSGECPAMSDPDVKNFTLTYPEVSIPHGDNTYFCKTFNIKDLGLDVHKNYHLVASHTNIASPVLHHVLAFVCSEEQEPVIEQPEECILIFGPPCNTLITTWTLNSPDDCYHSDFGFRIGGDMPAIKLQMHYNNQGEPTVDTSGITFYFTETLRPNDGDCLYIGPIRFTIPPALNNFTLKSTCEPRCTTDVLTGPVRIVEIFNHMHSLGRRLSVTLTRNGEDTVLVDEHFSYANPLYHAFPEPFEIVLGDQLTTRCHFSSPNRSEPTVWGQRSTDEMCYAFLKLYPRKHLQSNACLTAPYFNCMMEHQETLWT